MNRLLAILLLMLGVACAVPQAIAADTPEEFAARYLESIRKNGMKDLGSFIHPDEIKKLADLIVELADTAAAGDKAETIPFLKKGENAETLRKLSSAEIANRFFGWINEAIPQLTEMLKTAEVKTIGHVTDGDTVYVVAKLSFTMEGEVINGTDVLPLRRDGENYKALLKAEMTGILKAMKKAALRKGSK